VAKAAFTRSGANASLDDIAKQAGVGKGTLYRHFPSCDELLEAVYQTEVEKLAVAHSRWKRSLLVRSAFRTPNESAKLRGGTRPWTTREYSE
jgi:AcrR family transcriptional regulator